MTEELKFPQAMLQQAVKEVVDETLKDVVYDPLKMQATTEKLIDAILSKMVSQRLPYKVMTSATIT